MEPHSQGGEDSNADLGVDGIKTEIDGLMDSDGECDIWIVTYHCCYLVVRQVGGM